MFAASRPHERRFQLVPIKPSHYEGDERIRKDPNWRHYAGQATTPVSKDEVETLESFTHSDAARQAVEHARKIAHLTAADSCARARVYA